MSNMSPHKRSKHHELSLEEVLDRHKSVIHQLKPVIADSNPFNSDTTRLRSLITGAIMPEKNQQDIY